MPEEPEPPKVIYKKPNRLLQLIWDNIPIIGAMIVATIAAIILNDWFDLDVNWMHFGIFVVVMAIVVRWIL